jgi:hypothetical protein
MTFDMHHASIIDVNLEGLLTAWFFVGTETYPPPFKHLETFVRW